MLFTWNEKLSVNVKEMDNHHMQLLNLINELHDAMREGKSREIMSQILKKLADYTSFHFSAEEKYMEKFKFPGLDGQKAEHHKFIEKVENFQKQLAEGKLTLSMEVMSFLKDWLINHITISDKKYSLFFNEHGLK